MSGRHSRRRRVSSTLLTLQPLEPRCLMAADAGFAASIAAGPRLTVTQEQAKAAAGSQAAEQAGIRRDLAVAAAVVDPRQQTVAVGQGIVREAIPGAVTTPRIATETFGIDALTKDQAGRQATRDRGFLSGFAPGPRSMVGEADYDPSAVLPNGGQRNRNDRFSGDLAPRTLGEIRSGFASDGPRVGRPGDFASRHTSRPGGWTGTSSRSTSDDGSSVTVEVVLHGPTGTERYREVRSDGDKDGYAETLESRVVESTTSDGKSNRQETRRDDDGQYVTDTVRVTPGQAPEISHTTTSEPPAPPPLGHIDTGAGAGCVDPDSPHGAPSDGGTMGAINPAFRRRSAVEEAFASGFGRRVRPDPMDTGVAPPRVNVQVSLVGQPDPTNPRGGSGPGYQGYNPNDFVRPPRPS